MRVLPAVFALLAAAVSAEEGWPSNARSLVESALGERLVPATSVLSPASLPAGAELFEPDLRFFDVRPKSGARVAEGTPVVYVTRLGDAGFWSWAQEGIERVTRASDAPRTDPAALLAFARALCALPGGPAWKDANVVAADEAVRVRIHRIEGAFGCGFWGQYIEDLVVPRGTDPVVLTGDTDLLWGEYLTLIRSGDPLLDDRTEGAREMVEWLDRQGDELDALVKDLAGEPAAALAAERRLRLLGPGMIDRLESALPGAAPATAERLRRLVRWHRDAWSEDLDGEALAAAKRLAPEGTTLHGCAAVELPPGPLATAVRQKARFFRASYRDAAGSQPQLTLRLSPDGRAEPWAGDVAGLAELQSELGILASGPEGTRQAAQLCAALRAAAGEPGFLAEAEARRSEAGERSALFHLKTLWLGSGVLGYYHDRVDFTFDGAGLLSGMNQVTESLTVERMEELLAEADPLLRLDGWVTDARRRDLERRQRRGR